LGCNKDAKIDLHIHSTASDGTLTPSEILELAENLHLGAISLTDHDAVDGNRDLLKRGVPGSIGFLTGIEISACLRLFFLFLEVSIYSVTEFNMRTRH
jgi:3',5'-nucleoside bisphosphate phosphatase